MRKPSRLDRSKPYGLVSSGWAGDSDELDRAAAYEQQGRLYDSAGEEIIRGQPRKPPPAPPRPEVGLTGKPVPPDADAIRSPSELLMRESELSLRKLQQRARVILGELGEDCPTTRDDILQELERVLRDPGRRAPS